MTVCDEEKVVCGVTKHTTCADMIQALLDDHKLTAASGRLLHGEVSDFCLVERWKGLERALPPLTRILRLWYAWGDQRPFIKFILVKTSDFVPPPPPPPARKSVRSRGAGSKGKRWEHGRAQHGQQSLPVERQKRIVKKAFRKLEKLHKESRSFPGGAAAAEEEIERMVKLILDQDLTIREQIHRMRELDVELERLAENPVTQAGGSSDQQQQQQQQDYLYTSDGVEELELQVQKHQELILQLSRDIDAELQRVEHCQNAGTQASTSANAAEATPWIPSEADESFCAAELERLQAELRRSIFAGVSIHSHAAEIDKQLKLYEATLLSKDQECWQLAAQLSSLQIGEAATTAAATASTEEEQQVGPAPLKSETQCCSVKLKHSLSPLDVTDTDSDTGISSTHSQDSLSPCLDFPPPLDTDV